MLKPVLAVAARRERRPDAPAVSGVAMGGWSALEQHPELARLWTWHYAGRMALTSLDHRTRVGPPLLVKPA